MTNQQIGDQALRLEWQRRQAIRNGDLDRAIALHLAIEKLAAQIR